MDNSVIIKIDFNILILTERSKTHSMFALCFCYDRNYITGNAPAGIHVISSSESYEALVVEFEKQLETRQEDGKFEFGWELEYRLCILEYLENNTIKELKLVDHDDDFWSTQVQKTPSFKGPELRSEWV